MIKKFVLFSLVFCMVFCSTGASFAEQENPMFATEYSGVNVLSNFIVPEHELNDMYSQTMKEIESNNFSYIEDNANVFPMYVPIDFDGAETLYGPKKGEYKLSMVNVMALTLVSWICEYVVITDNDSDELAVLLIDALTLFASTQVDETYTKTWITQKWSSYYDCYIKYATVVHFSDDTYSTPLDVCYFELERVYN